MEYLVLQIQIASVRYVSEAIARAVVIAQLVSKMSIDATGFTARKIRIAYRESVWGKHALMQMHCAPSSQSHRAISARIPGVRLIVNAKA